MTRSTTALLSATFVALFAANASAHEIGTTRVSVRVGERGDYQVEIVTDAAALADKLETASGRTVSTDAPAARLQAIIAADEGAFGHRVHVRFDGVEVRPSFHVSVTPATDPLSAPAATIRLAGPLPSPATSFTWQYGWTFSSYSLAVAVANGAAPDPVWLEGDESSQAFVLNRIVPPPGRMTIARRYLVLGFAHILPLGLPRSEFVTALVTFNAGVEAGR